MEASIKSLQMQSWIPPKSSAHPIVTTVISNDKENLPSSRSGSGSGLVLSCSSSTAVTVTNGENVHKNNSKSRGAKGSIPVNVLKSTNANTNTRGAVVSQYASVPASIWVNTNDFPV